MDKIMERILVYTIVVGILFLCGFELWGPTMKTGYADVKVVDKIVTSEYSWPRFYIVLEDYEIIEIPASAYYTLNVSLPIRIEYRETYILHTQSKILGGS